MWDVGCVPLLYNAWIMFKSWFGIFYKFCQEKMYWKVRCYIAILLPECKKHTKKDCDWLRHEHLGVWWYMEHAFMSRIKNLHLCRHAHVWFLYLISWFQSSILDWNDKRTTRDKNLRSSNKENSIKFCRKIIAKNLYSNRFHGVRKKLKITWKLLQLICCSVCNYNVRL